MYEAGVLIAEPAPIQGTYLQSCHKLPAAIVTKLISLLSSVTRKVMFKPKRLMKCPLSYLFRLLREDTYESFNRDKCGDFGDRSDRPEDRGRCFFVNR